MVNLYRDKLPCDCPPDDADDIAIPLTMFRLIKGDKPSNRDFKSLRQKKPLHVPPREMVCISAGLSLFQSLRAIKQTVIYKKGGHTIYEIKLTPGAGKIKQTGRVKDHFTFWPYEGFDIFANIRKVKS